MLLALAPSVPVVMLARLLAGGGQQATGVGRQAFTAAAVATHHRGRVVGLLGGVSRIGGIAGPLIGGVMAQLYGFRAAFMLQAALNALGVLLVQLAMPSPEGGGGGGGRGSANKKTGAGCFDIIGEFWHSLLVSQKRRAHVFRLEKKHRNELPYNRCADSSRCCCPSCVRRASSSYPWLARGWGSPSRKLHWRLRWA